MTDKETLLPTKYYDTKSAAKYLGLSHKTLEKYRVYGGGPRFLKMGHRARYLVADLDSWVGQNYYNSTSEYEGKTCTAG